MSTIVHCASRVDSTSSALKHLFSEISQPRDYFRMKRVRQYLRWHKYNCEHIDEWSKLEDIRSLESERQLSVCIGAADTPVSQAHRGEAAPDVAADIEDTESAIEDEPAQPEHTQVQNADPFADSLGRTYEPAGNEPP